MSSSKRKSEKLGMPYGTARNRLVKSLLWHYVCKNKENFCYQCGSEILYINDLSIEHIKPWENSSNPIEMYFDLRNIAYSHLSCNVGARVKSSQPCPSKTSYTKGCRCDECKKEHRLYAKKTYSQEKRRKKYLTHGY